MVPQIPPLEPLAPISSSPQRPSTARPEAGIRSYAEEEKGVAARLARLHEDVAHLWKDYSVKAIADYLTISYGVEVTRRMVWNARPVDTAED